MNGHGFSQKDLVHDEILLEETEEMEILLNTVSDAEAGVSDGVLEQVRRFLDKVSEVCGPLQEVKHELLQRTFKYLQAWAQSPALGRLLEFGIVRILATMYDNFIQTDYARSEVLTSILELLFIVEDMSDSAEGKIQCGKLFLFRLLAFVTATTKTPSLKLQRAAVDTLCALVTRSPENQQAVLDQKVECYKLFKVFLPKCGDFQLQASITEIFYRLAKRGPQLLEFIQDRDVRKSIESLMQSKNPDLLLEIRKIVTLLNESLGRLRSVYSFLAECIFINGHEMLTSDKWVNIGRAQLSFYISGLQDSDANDPSIMDLQYEDIMELKRSSPTLLEILVQDRAGLSFFKALGGKSDPSTILHTQMYFNPADLSTIEASILPKFRIPSAGRNIQEKRESSSHFIDKSTHDGSKGGPVNSKTVHCTNMNRQPGNEVSPAEDGRLPERANSRGRSEKSSFDSLRNAPDFVSETPQDLDTHEGSAIAKSSKPPGSHAQGCCQPQVASVSSTFERFNPLPVAAARQPFPRRQEDRPLQNSNTDAYHNMSSGLTIDSQADAKQSSKVAIATTDGNKKCENDRPSKPSHLQTQNLHALPGPKTKSPSDANVRARPVCNLDDETDDEIDNRANAGELRMKKRHDPQRTNVVSLESPRHPSKSKTVDRNTLRQVKDGDVLHLQRSSESSEKNPITPIRDMPASDSVMTDIRAKPLSSGKGTKSCCKKSSRAAPSCASEQTENRAKSISRTLRTRQCKKAIRYFDADDEQTSAASDSSTEFVVARQKNSRDKVADPIVDKSAKRGAQTITKRARRAAAQDESRALTVCRRNDPTPPNKHQHGQTISARRKQNCSTKTQANHERRVVCGANSINDDADDVFRFSPNPANERQSPKNLLVLSCKAKQNSTYSEPSRKRMKKSVESHNLQTLARQPSCTSDGPRPIVSVRPAAQIMKSPPRALPAVSPPALQKQKEVTPEQQGRENAGMSAFSRSSDTDHRSRSPALQARKTYSKSGRIITKNSRLERWRSFSIRKLELPKMDSASEDESIDGATPASSPLEIVLEQEAAQDGEDSSGIGMIAKLLKSFKQKVKLVEKRTVEDILSNTMQRIQAEIRSAEERIRGEKAEFTDACNKKCGTLDSQRQEKIKKMQALCDKFQQDFAQHLEKYEGIGGEIEETELELNELAKQQGQDHKDVLAKLKESCKNHLAEADQKILEAGKSSTGMRSLKEALQGILKDL